MTYRLWINGQPVSELIELPQDQYIVDLCKDDEVRLEPVE